MLKSLEADRLILDSRPHNLLEAFRGRFIRTLGAADPVLQIHLEPEDYLYVSSNDIRDFYHLFRVSDERCRRNSLVATASPREVSSFKAFRSWMFRHSELYVGLACLAMGDTQAVELAQSCHLGICLQNKIIQGDTLVAMNLLLGAGLALALSLMISWRSQLTLAGPKRLHQLHLVPQKPASLQISLSPPTKRSG